MHKKIILTAGICIILFSLTSCSVVNSSNKLTEDRSDETSEDNINNNDVFQEKVSSESDANIIESEEAATNTDVIILESLNEQQKLNSDEDVFADFDNHVNIPPNYKAHELYPNVQVYAPDLFDNVYKNRDIPKEIPAESGFKIEILFGNSGDLIFSLGLTPKTGFSWFFSGQRGKKYMTCLVMPNEEDSKMSMELIIDDTLKILSDNLRVKQSAKEKQVFSMPNDAIKAKIGNREFILTKVEVDNDWGMPHHLLQALTFIDNNVLVFSYSFDIECDSQEERATFIQILESLQKLNY